jgi:hypothetical protein
VDLQAPVRLQNETPAVARPTRRRPGQARYDLGATAIEARRLQHWTVAAPHPKAPPQFSLLEFPELHGVVEAGASGRTSRRPFPVGHRPPIDDLALPRPGVLKAEGTAVGVPRLVGSSKASAIDHEVASSESNDYEAFVAQVPQPIFPVGDMTGESGEARPRVTVVQLAIVEQGYIAVGVLKERGKVQAAANRTSQLSGGSIAQGQSHLK